MALTAVKRGSNQLRQIGIVVLLLLLAGCQPALHVELLNDSDETVYAQDVDKGSVAVSPGGNAILDIYGRHLVVENPQKLSFDLNLPPLEHVHTTRHGLFVYAVLGKDGLLYLAAKHRDGNLVRLDPQPDGFPLHGK